MFEPCHYEEFRRAGERTLSQMAPGTGPPQGLYGGRAGSVIAPLSPKFPAYARGLVFAVIAGLSLMAVALLVRLPTRSCRVAAARCLDGR